MVRLFVMILTALVSINVSAQNSGDNDSLSVQRKLFPQEKVYVTTDRELYSTGDTIWFRGWVVDGESLKEKSDSRYLYVELRDVVGNIMNRVRVRANKENVFEGYVPLDITMPSNGYTLIAYTYYMIGTNESHFFKKMIDVLQPMDLLNGYTSKALAERVYPEKYKDVAPGKIPVEFDVPSGGSYSVSVTHFSMNPAKTDDIKVNLPAQAPLFTNESVARDGYLKPTYPYEQGNVVSGTVYGNFNTLRPQKDVTVSVSAFADSLYYVEGKTDAKGRFEIPSPEVPDSVLYLVQARKKKSSKVNIEFDAPVLPERVSALPVLPNHFVNVLNKETFDDNTKKWALSLKNNQAVMLNEIIIKEKMLHPTYQYERQTTKTKIFTDEESQNIRTYQQLLSSLGITKNHHGLLYNRNHIDIYFDDTFTLTFEGLPLHYEKRDHDDRVIDVYEKMADYYPPYMIKAAEILSPVEAMHLPQSATRNNYVLKLTIRKGKDLDIFHMDDCKMYNFLGSQKHRDFPQNVKHKDYSAPVIYWNPSLKSDSNGKAAFSLIVPETENATYRISLEGIAPDGQLIHKEKFVRIKEGE